MFELLIFVFDIEPRYPRFETGHTKTFLEECVEVDCMFDLVVCGCSGFPGSVPANRTNDWMEKAVPKHFGLGMTKLSSRLFCSRKHLSSANFVGIFIDGKPQIGVRDRSGC